MALLIRSFQVEVAFPNELITINWIFKPLPPVSFLLIMEPSDSIPPHKQNTFAQLCADNDDEDDEVQLPLSISSAHTAALETMNNDPPVPESCQLGARLSSINGSFPGKALPGRD